MKVRFKKVSENAITPRYALDGDACLDLYASCILQSKLDEVVIDTGIALEIPEGFVGLLFPRSSISKTNYMLKNGVGVIDSSYRGPIMIKLRELKGDTWNSTYKVGDKVAQIMIIPRPIVELVEVEKLSNTDRGASGFGSTGC